MNVSLDSWYKLLAPRPVVLVSTISKKGISNIAPFSFVAPVSTEPPLLAFASDPSHDTVRNIRTTKDFVVNIPGIAIINKLWACAEDFPPQVSEFEKTGLHEAKSSTVRSPYCKECLAHFECSLHALHRTGDHIVMVGKVRRARVEDAFFKKGKYLVDKARVLMHVGSERFATVGRLIKAQ